MFAFCHRAKTKSKKTIYSNSIFDLSRKTGKGSFWMKYLKPKDTCKMTFTKIMVPVKILAHYSDSLVINITKILRYYVHILPYWQTKSEKTIYSNPIFDLSRKTAKGRIWMQYLKPKRHLITVIKMTLRRAVKIMAHYQDLLMIKIIEILRYYVHILPYRRNKK
jgi:hypothetical protein